MKLFYPDIFKKFQCIGSECKDNCCRTGWDIEIDDDTYKFYKSLNDDMGKKLTASIIEEDGCHYLMHDDGCPFLNEKGLCSVLLKYGEDKISEICANHPRFFEWFGSYKEAGTGLACEESARLWLSAPKIVFSECEIDEADDDLNFDESSLSLILSARKALISLAQNKNFTLSQRMKLILLYSAEAQDDLDFDDFEDFEYLTDLLSSDDNIREQLDRLSENSLDECKEALSSLLKYFQALDFLGDILPESLKSAENHLDEIISSRDRFFNAFPQAEQQFENVLVYYIFRYFIKAVRSFDALSKLIFAVCSVLITETLSIDSWLRTESLDFSSQIEIVKEYSKEIDYSFENTEKIFEDCYTESVLSLENLLKTL